MYFWYEILNISLTYRGLSHAPACFLLFISNISVIAFISVASYYIYVVEVCNRSFEMGSVFKLDDKLIPPPSDEERIIAAQSSSQLAAIVGKGDNAQIRVVSGNDDITVPVSAIKMLVDILSHMAEGDAVSLIPHHAEFTTQQAADFLNVSRPYFVESVLKKGLVDFHQVGSHRRIYFRDLVNYKNLRLDKSRKAMAELTAEAQELDMGYD